MLVYQRVCSLFWVVPPPRMQSSPPGLWTIFSRESRTEPSFPLLLGGGTTQSLLIKTQVMYMLYIGDQKLPGYIAGLVRNGAYSWWALFSFMSSLDDHFPYYQGTILCTPNVRVLPWYLLCSTLGFLGIITHKYPLHRAYIGISHRGA